jgi:hypothetical protein
MIFIVDFTVAAIVSFTRELLGSFDFKYTICLIFSFIPLELYSTFRLPVSPGGNLSLDKRVTTVHPQVDRAETSRISVQIFVYLNT